MQTMARLILESEDEESLRLIEALARKMGVCIEASEGKNGRTTSEQSKEMKALLDEMAERGTLLETIPDPVAWQREIRKDRKLPFRD